MIKTKKYLEYLLLAVVLAFTVSGSYTFYQGLVNGKMQDCGWYWNSLFFAGIAITAEIVCFCALLFDLWRGKYSCFLYIPFVIIWGAIIYDYARGAWLAIGCGFLSIYFLVKEQYKKKWFKLIGILILETAVLLSLNSNIGARAKSIITDGAKPQNARYLIWESSIKMFLDYPVTGVGLGQYYPYYDKQYSLYNSNGRIRHAHNDFIHMLAENGLVGFCGFIAMFWVICWKHWHKLNENFNPYSVMCLATVITFLAHGLTEYNFGANAGVIMVFWLVVGLTTTLAELEE